MTVFILRQVNTEEKAYEATSVSIHSTRERAIERYLKSIDGYNAGIEPTDEYWVHPEATADELRADSFTEWFGGQVIWDLTEYEVDSDEIAF